MESDFVEALEVVDAAEGLRDTVVVLAVGAAVFRVGMGIAGCAVEVCSECKGEGFGVSETWKEFPPGKGKEFRSGLVVLI